MNVLCITTNLNSGELASWVQAIGSILAIVTGMAAVYLQVRATRAHALEAETRETRRRLSALKAVLDDARQQCLKLRNWVEADTRGHLRLYLGSTSPSFQNALQRLREVSPFDICHRDLAERTNSIAVHMEAISRMLDRDLAEQRKLLAAELVSRLDGAESDFEGACHAMLDALHTASQQDISKPSKLARLIFWRRNVV